MLITRHVGLTPKTIVDFKYQGRILESSNYIKFESKKIGLAGCCALVMEFIFSELEQEIYKQCQNPNN